MYNSRTPVLGNRPKFDDLQITDSIGTTSPWISYCITRFDSVDRHGFGNHDNIDHLLRRFQVENPICLFLIFGWWTPVITRVSVKFFLDTSIHEAHRNFLHARPARAFSCIFHIYLHQVLRRSTFQRRVIFLFRAKRQLNFVTFCCRDP